jgi:hypothetical protein
MTVLRRLVLIAVAALSSPAALPLSIQLPDASTALKPGVGADQATAYCSICHSLDYITTQPPGMPRAFWASEVTKMKNVFGAPIPDSAVTPLVDYLVNAYGAP